MKKIYTLAAAIALTAFSANAQQNLIAGSNPGFDTWTSDTQPAGFEPFTSATLETNQNLMKESTIVKSAPFSARQMSVEVAGAGKTQALEFQPIPVIQGHSYTISYYYYDNSTTARTRMWSTWLNEASSATGINQASVQLDAYSTNSAEWKLQTVTVTPPAGAAFLRLQVRTYREAVGAFGGYVYYDDFSIVDNSVAGVDKNVIAGLKMFPNPLTGGELNISSDSSDTKSVQVYNVLGKQVLAAEVVNGTVNASQLSAGVYMVQITEAGKTATKKLIVK
ncbi:MAG: T9SS type A sorting domain-containing protein [Flavobacterium sp.]|nr:MAG: T9SS type A sorting domain-containing protein [Flavobacterium sp.]